MEKDSILLSGWLFADLLLALAVIFLAMSPGAPPRPPEAEPTAVATPTPTAAPLPTATPLPQCERSVTLTKIERTTPNSLAGGPPSIPTDEQLMRTFADLSESTVGLVNVYVRVQSPGQGQPLARQVSERLRRTMPRLFPADAIYEPFDHVDPNPATRGGVLFQLYLLSDVCR